MGEVEVEIALGREVKEEKGLQGENMPKGDRSEAKKRVQESQV